MQISVSNGIEYFETKQFNTVRELAEQACLTNISTSVFKPGQKRNIHNFLFAECIGLDFDNAPGEPQLTVEEAKLAFKEYKHLILASRSHRKNKKGVIADRFRVILFLEYPITNPDDFYATWFSLQNKFPATDDQCKDPSRFWFRHQSVLGGNDGKLITPVKAVKTEKKETKPVTTRVHGELSKETLKVLEFGIVKGQGKRNGTVFKTAKDFQQNLYSLEFTEARIIEALHRNETIDQDFTEEEARRTIQSAFNRDPKHEPRLEETKPRAFNYFSLAEVLSTPDREEDWLIEGLLIKGGLSIIVGAPKIGKTTIVRQLEKCVLRGERFLNRKVSKGSILHFSFDEKAKTAKRHYRALGLNEHDPLILHFGAADSESVIVDFEQDLMEKRPALAVVDTLFDLADVEDINNYISIKKKLTLFGTIAEKTGTHILFIHHQTKPNQNYASGNGVSVLGSQAIFASVDCCMVFEQHRDNKKMRTLSVQGRGVEDFEKTTLVFDKFSQSYNIEPEVPF